MATITQRPKVEVSATFLLTEEEIGALDALAGYGVDPFLEVFYAKLGKAYMQPYEEGLRSLFESVRRQVPGILRRAKEAREVFEGAKIAAPRPADV